MTSQIYEIFLRGQASLNNINVRHSKEIKHSIGIFFFKQGRMAGSFLPKRAKRESTADSASQPWTALFNFECLILNVELFASEGFGDGDE